MLDSRADMPWNRSFSHGGEIAARHTFTAGTQWTGKTGNMCICYHTDGGSLRKLKSRVTAVQSGWLT